MTSLRVTLLAALLLLFMLDLATAMKKPVTAPQKPKGKPAGKPAGKPNPKTKHNNGKKAKMPPTKLVPQAVRDELRRRLKAAGGCNANVCFAIDGSSRMPAAQFRAQKNFVLDLVSIIAVDEPVELSAMQYSDKRYPITPLTVDTAAFNLKVSAAPQRGGASFTRAGIEFCSEQLAKRPGEANKLVLLGDGKTSAGKNAIHRANRFRNLGGDMSVVAAGKKDRVRLLALAGWRKDRLFDAGNFFDVLRVRTIIKKLVTDICEVGGRVGFPNRKPPRFTDRDYNMKARKARWTQYCKTHSCTWRDAA